MDNQNKRKNYGNNKNEKNMGSNDHKDKTSSANEQKKTDQLTLKDLRKYWSVLFKRGFYTDPEKEKLDPDFVLLYAKEVAANLDIEGRGDVNKRTQIRKYYDYLKRVEQKLCRYDMDYTYIKADVASLHAKVKYAMDRKVVSKQFVLFLDHALPQIKDAKDFKAFMKHFEAVIAYMKKDTN